jgi:hypothetical protein
MSEGELLSDPTEYHRKNYAVSRKKVRITVNFWTGNLDNLASQSGKN